MSGPNDSDPMSLAQTPATGLGASAAQAKQVHAMHAPHATVDQSGVPPPPRGLEALRIQDALDRARVQAREARTTTSASAQLELPIPPRAVQQPLAPPAPAGDTTAPPSEYANPVFSPLLSFAEMRARREEANRTPFLRNNTSTNPEHQQLPGSYPQQAQYGLPSSRGGPTFSRKLPLFPGFSGSYVPGVGKLSTSVADYEFEVNHCLKLHHGALLDHGLSEDLIVMMLGEQTQGLAKDWYRRLCKEENALGQKNPALLSVKGWLAAIREKFTEPNVELAIRHKFARLSMGSHKGALRSFNNAFNECLMLLNRLGPEHEESNKFDYMDGLRSDFRKECARLPNIKSMTLNDIQQMLERLEMATYDAGFYNTSQPRNDGPTPMELGATALSKAEGQSRRGGGRGGRGDRGEGGGRGGRGGRVGRGRGRGGSKSKPRAPVPRDPEQEAIRKECIEKGLCFRCRKPGHAIRDCPVAPPAQGNAQ